MSTGKQQPFTKAAETTVPVERSKEQLATLVRRYGAAGFSVSEDFVERRAHVEMLLPEDPGSPHRVPVRIPVPITEVRRRLPMPNLARVRRTREQVEQDLWAQAERTAWRIVVDLVDALLMQVQLGGRRVSEAFLADVIVAREDGSTERMAEYMTRTGGALPGGARALLPRGE